MSVELLVGGQWLSTIAGWGELEWSHSADGGCYDAKFKVDLPSTYAANFLSRSKPVRIMYGSEPVWSGFFSEPDVDGGEWSFTCQGLYAQGAQAVALDASGAASSTPNTAVDVAISAGTVKWTRSASISSTAWAPAGDQAPDLLYVSELLDGYAESTGQRWGVGADGVVYMRADPTIPTWHLAPGSGRFGLADDEYASDLLLRYQTTGGAFATVRVFSASARDKFGRREYPVDITGRGPLSQSQATAHGNGLLAKGAPRLGYTNTLEVSRFQLTTPGGSPACLPLVKAGDMVRLHGVQDEQGQDVPWVDFVIGSTSYEAGSDVITLAPVELVDRTLGDVLGAA